MRGRLYSIVRSSRFHGELSQRVENTLYDIPCLEEYSNTAITVLAGVYCHAVLDAHFSNIDRWLCRHASIHRTI